MLRRKEEFMPRISLIFWIVLWVAAMASVPVMAGQPTLQPAQSALEWFNAPPDKSAVDVNEGNLVFLKKPPAKPAHHHHNAITLNRQTLANGWAALSQCHENLDQVGSAQILFNPKRTRKLAIASYSGIGKAWVENSSVQMKNIGPGAKLCITAQSRVLYGNGDGTYTLKNGPFMRKFLDGFYPLHLSMQVKYDNVGLRFLRTSPPPQEGFVVQQQNREVNLDTWFEGKLITEIHFVATSAP